GQQPAGPPSQATGISRDAPNPDVGVQQQQRHWPLMSYSPSMGSSGRSYSSTVPFMDPKNGFRSGPSNGTSFATGLPCLVMMYSAPVSRTRSIRSRHVVLNSAALTRPSAGGCRGPLFEGRDFLLGMTTI